MKNKLCLQCSDPIQGRSDKKFCDSYCRSQYHNERSANESVLLQKIERILRKNRRILLMIAGKSGMVISRSKLKEMGFQFDYFTHRIQEEKGDTYYYCYDRGLLPLDETKVAVVCKEDGISFLKPED